MRPISSCQSQSEATEWVTAAQFRHRQTLGDESIARRYSGTQKEKTMPFDMWVEMMGAWGDFGGFPSGMGDLFSGLADLLSIS